MSVSLLPDGKAFYIFFISNLPNNPLMRPTKADCQTLFFSLSLFPSEIVKYRREWINGSRRRNQFPLRKKVIIITAFLLNVGKPARMTY